MGGVMKVVKEGERGGLGKWMEELVIGIGGGEGEGGGWGVDGEGYEGGCGGGCIGKE